MSKKAFILGAGFGTRMRPLTIDRPKPLVEVGGVPLIDRVMARLTKAGVEKFIVNVHYQGEKLINHFAKTNQMNVIISDERNEILDTGGGVFHALPLLGEEPFFIHNSDSIWIEDQINNLKELAKNFDPSKMDGLLLLAPLKTSVGFYGKGDFFCSAEGLLERRGTKAKAPYVFTGASIVSPSLFKNCKQGVFSLNMPFDEALANKRLYGQILDGRWMHVGTPEDVAKAELCLDEKS